MHKSCTPNLNLSSGGREKHWVVEGHVWDSIQPKGNVISEIHYPGFIVPPFLKREGDLKILFLILFYFIGSYFLIHNLNSNYKITFHIYASRAFQ